MVSDKDTLEIFTRFYQALIAKDIDAAMALVADEALFSNGLGKWSGSGQIRAYLHDGLVKNKVAFEMSDFQAVDDKVTYAYQVLLNGARIDGGRDGLALVEQGRISFFGTEAGLAASRAQAPAAQVDTSAAALGPLIPLPLSAQATGGSFTLGADAKIYIYPADDELREIGLYLSDKLRPSTGYALPVLAIESEGVAGDLLLTTVGSDPALGEEGYDLTVTQRGVRLSAHRPAGLFRGIQTIRQLLPSAIDSATVQPGPWSMPAGTIHDMPRFAWRGTMLDVARHFFAIEDVKRYIDLAAYYKLNTFHLHLTDDQGWRIEIKSWPRLAQVGGETQIQGGPGGYYTQEQYAEIVAYAQSRYITIVPEIDIPGHTNAALVAYPELNCDDRKLEPYTGMEVGFSTLCMENEEIYKFVDDVITEIAALTPGRYIHIGGDEARATKPEEYGPFIEHVQEIVQAHGKETIGWDEIAQARLLPGTLAQRWNLKVSPEALQKAGKVLMSPASKAYLDMKYTEQSTPGQTWAGYIEVQEGYEWDPATVMPGIGEEAVIGVEAPLWSETLKTMADLEMMAFPRLPGYAEIGWSPQASRSWEEYRLRLAAHGPRLKTLGISFYPSPQVPWK